MENTKHSSAPILPFDGRLNENFIIYDNVSYIRNRDMCNEKIMLNTGNVIKNYNCKPEQSTILISSEHSKTA